MLSPERWAKIENMIWSGSGLISAEDQASKLLQMRKAADNPARLLKPRVVLLRVRQRPMAG
jgi:hypothetical protein